MKDYQKLIGSIIIAVAIVGAGILIANTIEVGLTALGNEVSSACLMLR